MTSALTGARRGHTASAVNPLTPRGRGKGGSRLPSSTTEHVIYRYDPGCTPSITYHSIPHRCTGASNELDEARNSYRRDIADVLSVGRPAPSAVEHLEAALAGMWVRAKVSAVHRDPCSDQLFLLTVLAEGSVQDALRAHLTLATTPGSKPVVVIVEPYEAVGAVLDQARAADTLFVVHSDAENVLEWIAIHGPAAGRASNAPQLVDYVGLRTMPIRALTQMYAAGTKEVQLRPNQLRDAG
jgi:hypothetical protein